MNTLVEQSPRSRSWFTTAIFIMVLAAGLALALFVNRATTQIREALAQEVLQQQHDVANLMHEYSTVMLAVERSRNQAEASSDQVDRALESAQKQLELMRFQYTFERLDGAATAHAYAKPVIEDVAQWLGAGLPGQAVDRQQILDLVAQRLSERYSRLRAITTETDEVAESLIADQSAYLNRFRGSLISLLGFYALLALGFAAMLIRQRNLQTQLRVDQENYAERIADFADIGADWFWEMTHDLKLKLLSDRDWSAASNVAHDGAANDISGLNVDGRVTNHWPMQNLNNRLQFHEYESEWKTPGGDTRVIAMSGKPLFDNKGVFNGFRGIGRDITERRKIEKELQTVYQELIAAQRQGRRQAEEALRDSEQFLSTSLDAMAPSIAILDRHATIKAANRAWRELTAGAVPDGGVGLHYVLSLRARPADEQQAFSSIETNIDNVLVGNEDRFRFEFQSHYNDEIGWVEIKLTTFTSNDLRYAVMVYEDITEQRKLEDRDRKLRADLAHVARLNTAGEMASVLAHEINQPLTAISHNCDALLSSTIEQPAEIVRETMQDIYDQSQRAGGIIHSMRQMMRKDAPQTKSVDINQLVKDTVRLTTPEARESQVSVSLELAENLPMVTIDPVQIQQVLVNLERNGVEAIRHSEATTRALTIKTELVSETSIQVSVRDTGPGVTPEVEKTLFTSFNTTKLDGMGMGLSISRSIVEAHGGRLWLDNGTSGMTTFTFSLPITKGEKYGHR